MKKGFLVLTAVFLFIGGALAVSAQDLIILRDGSVIEAKVTEISPSEIRYKRANHLDGPTIVVPVPTVLSIRYANGKVDQFNAAPAAPVAPAAPTAPAPATTATRPPASAPSGAPAPAPSAPAAAAATAATVAAAAGAPPAATAAVGAAAAIASGDFSIVQDALNRIPAIPVAGKNLKFIFSGETWRAQVSGKDTLSGTLTFQGTEGGGIITLKPTHAYVLGKQVPTPAPEILLEYTPPMSLRSLSKKEQQAFAQQAVATQQPVAQQPTASAGGAPAASISTQPAPDGTVVWEGNGHKYLVVDRSMTWDKANAYAAEQGGYLATITSAEKQAFIEALLATNGKHNNYYLGGYREGKNWQWVSGEPWEYTNWLPTYPDNSGGRETKLMIVRVLAKGVKGKVGQWNDFTGASKGVWGTLGFIIEWNGQAAAGGAPAALISAQPGPDNAVIWEGNGHKYLLVDQQMTWDKANAYAAEQGGYLAAITGVEEQIFVQNLIAGGNKNFYWLGGQRTGNQWVWTSGEPWKYTNWGPGQPDNFRSRQNKLIMMRITNPALQAARTGQWDDCANDGRIGGEAYFAADQKGFVIEWNE